MLPAADEQEWLLDETAALIARRGFAPYVTAHLLEPTPRFFPDPWRPTAGGVCLLARRLLGFAGLDHLDVAVELFANPDEVRELDDHGRARAWGHSGAAAWFAGIQGDRCLFGADARLLDEPDGIVGSMAHEVAHAYRRCHHLVEADRDAEELLTDLTTVFLGFGVLTTNNAYRYRAGGGLQGGATVTTWSHSRIGYLPPEAMSFLLAAQVVARGGAAREVRRVAGLLEANQAAAFRDACKILEPHRLAARLELPAPETWPAPEISLPLSPFDDEAGDDPGSARAEVVRQGFNSGRPVFRVKGTAGLSWGIRGLLLSGAVAGVALAIGVPGFVAGGLLVVGLAVGYRGGAARRRDVCSEPACESVLDATATVCPGCGGTVAGTIDDASERLDAEEKLGR